MRAHWNRQKAKTLGNKLFCLVICDIFNIIKSNTDHTLSDKEKVIYYVDLIINLLEEKIQFNQSMARPVIPLACFEKAASFKKLMNNILESFNRENVSISSIRTTRTVKDGYGNTTTEYIADPKR